MIKENSKLKYLLFYYNLFFINENLIVTGNIDINTSDLLINSKKPNLLNFQFHYY